MTETKDKVREEINELQTLRDDLRVRLHLASNEVKDRWKHAEDRWVEVEGRLQELQKVGTESARDVTAALSVLRDEIRTSYQKIKEAL